MHVTFMVRCSLSRKAIRLRRRSMRPMATLIARRGEERNWRCSEIELYRLLAMAPKSSCREMPLYSSVLLARQKKHEDCTLPPLGATEWHSFDNGTLITLNRRRA